MGHCKDCGTKLSSGICPNCQEELYIYENQMYETDFELSEGFMVQVEKQRHASAQHTQPAIKTDGHA